MGLFTGLSTTAVAARMPDPKVGVADFLVNTIRQKENRDGGYRIVCDLTCLRSVEGGNEKGDRVQYCLFSGDYFLKEVKRLILALLDVAPSREQEVIDIVADMDPAIAKMDERAKGVAGWERIAQMMCAMDANDKPTAAGMFDGNAVIRLETVCKAAKPTGKFIKNSAGELVEEMGKEFINTYPVKMVPISEVVADFDEKDIERFFGSAEALEALVSKE
jgi:hypothetical protein